MKAPLKLSSFFIVVGGDANRVGELQRIAHRLQLPDTFYRNVNVQIAVTFSQTSSALLLCYFLPQQNKPHRLIGVYLFHFCME